MRHAFALIELMIVIAIISIIAAIAIPNIIATPNQMRPVGDGSATATAVVKATGTVVTVVALDRKTYPVTYICRVDNGSEARPRYSEIRFTGGELDLAAAVEASKQ